MSCCDDQRLNRRDFVAAAAATAAGLGILGAAASPALAQATSQPSSSAGLDVGAKDSFTKDGANMNFVKANHVIVMRESGKLYAMSSRCTHKRCDVKDVTGSFHCPCHNSDFAYDGSATGGPATKAGPLPRYGISVNDAGHVIVNVHKIFDKSQWTDPGSFVAVS